MDSTPNALSIKWIGRDREQRKGKPMEYVLFTEEQKQRANATDLVEFLKSQREEMIRSGKEWWWKRYDSVTIEGNRWYRHCRKERDLQLNSCRSQWKQHSYQSLDGVSEHAMVHLLRKNSHLKKIVLCLDHDPAGVEASYRLKEILNGMGYEMVTRLASNYKDWNEDLESLAGMESIPTIEHPKLQMCQRFIRIDKCHGHRSFCLTTNNQPLCLWKIQSSSPYRAFILNFGKALTDFFFCRKPGDTILAIPYRFVFNSI